MSTTSPHCELTRRTFLRAAALAGAAAGISPLLKGGASSPSKAGAPAPKGKFIEKGKPFRLAAVGVGGQGGHDLKNVWDLREKGFDIELVAVCDVDDARAEKTYAAHPDVPRFKDYREMLAKMGKDFDACLVGTPDHMHYPIAIAMLEAGKHVYVQKPLAHSIGEVRALRAKAREKGVVAQMGNQGASHEGTQLQEEWIKAGAVGNVREVVAWTNRPIWPQGIPEWYPEEPVPPTMDWDKWIGVSDMVAYNANYVPFKWRGYWEWGCGALGDMACHTLDAAVRALDLVGDCSVVAEMQGETPVSFPKGAKVVYEFPERNGRPALKLTWYEGICKPPRPAELGSDEKGEIPLSPSGGSLYYGDKGILYNGQSHSQITPRLLPKEAMDAFKKNIPAKTLTRYKGGAYASWVRACYGEAPSPSDIAHAASDVSEIVLLGALAMRAGNGQKLVWDSAKGCVVGRPDLDKYIHKTYRSF